MVRLAPMTEAEFQNYLEQDIRRYADEHVKAGDWAPSEALDNSRKEHEQLLPDGLKTRNQYLFKLVDEQTGSRVGWIWMAVRTDTAIPHAFIYDFLIDRDQRRRGYATQALSAADQWLNSMGVKQVSLHVFGHNHIAQALYEKMGFEITGVFMRKAVSGSLD